MARPLSRNIINIVENMQNEGINSRNTTEFVDLVQPFMERQAYKYCDNEADRQDIIQETYCKVLVLGKIKDLQDSTKVLPWLSSILSRESLQVQRKRKNDATVSYDDSWTDEDENEFESAWKNRVLQDPDGSVEDVIDKKETVEAVDEVLAMLPDYQRLPLLMNVCQGIPIKAIAAEMGVSENTIKSRLKQGKDKLYKMSDEFVKRGIPVAGVSILVLINAAWTMDMEAEAAELGIALISGASIGAAAAVSGTAAKKAATEGGKTLISTVKAHMAVKAAVVGTAAAVAGGSIYGVNQVQIDQGLKNALAGEHTLAYSDYAADPEDIKILKRTVTEDFSSYRSYKVNYRVSKNLISYDVSREVYYDKETKEYKRKGVNASRVHDFEATGIWEGNIYYLNEDDPIGEATLTIDDIDKTDTNAAWILTGSHEEQLDDSEELNDQLMAAANKTPEAYNEVHTFTDGELNTASGNITIGFNTYKYDIEKDALIMKSGALTAELKKSDGGTQNIENTR